MSPSSYARLPTTRRRACAALAEATVAAALTLCGAAQSERQESLLVDDPRPVAEAVKILATRHEHVITYEDPRYLFTDDIKDVTREVRKDLDRFPPGQAPKVLIPLGGRIDFKYQVIVANNAPEDWGAVLNDLLATHAAGGRGARFRLARSGDVHHVIPAEIRNAAGQWVKTASILDAYITIPEQELTKTGIVEAVVAAVGEAMQVGFGIGTCIVCGIHSASPEPVERFAVDNELARDVLLRALNHWRPGTGWLIFQQPGSDMYVLNVTFSPPREPAPRPLGPPRTTAAPPAVHCGYEPTPAGPVRCGPGLAPAGTERNSANQRP